MHLGTLRCASANAPLAHMFEHVERWRLEGDCERAVLLDVCSDLWRPAEGERVAVRLERGHLAAPSEFKYLARGTVVRSDAERALLSFGGLLAFVETPTGLAPLEHVTLIVE